MKSVFLLCVRIFHSSVINFYDIVHVRKRLPQSSGTKHFCLSCSIEKKNTLGECDPFFHKENVFAPWSWHSSFAYEKMNFLIYKSITSN